MLDDAAFDVEAWLANEIALEFAKAVALATTAYAIDIDAQSEGWVRVSDGGTGIRVVVFDSGIASDWTGGAGADPAGGHAARCASVRWRARRTRRRR